MKKLSALTLAGIGLLLVASPVYSQSFIDFQSGGTLVVGNSLTGTVTYEGWNNLTTSRITNNPLVSGDNTTRPYGWHNLQNSWSATIASNLGSGSSTLFKSEGYGYIAGSSLHQGAGTFDLVPGGSFSITSTAISGLETVVFQIEATDRGGALPNTLGSIFHSLPTLSFGSNTLDADFDSLFNVTWATTSGGFGPQHRQFLAFQWDLRDYAFAGGEQFTINWTGLVNSGIFGMQLNQGDAFLQVVPEPSTWLLLGLGLTIFLIMRRRRANACADA